MFWLFWQFVGLCTGVVLLWCVAVLFLIPYRFVRALVRHDIPIEPRPWSLNPYRVSENIFQKLFPPPARLKQQQRAHGDQGSEDQEFARQQEEERLIAVAHKESPFKHIPGLPWGDPTSYAKVSTVEELEQAREALNKWTAEKYEREAQLALEQERKRLAEEKREQEAREYLIRESERLQREREEREMWPKSHEPEPEPIASAPLIVVGPPSPEAEAELCKCGYPGCLGHEIIKGQIIFPGFTSEAAMAQSPHELVCLNVEVTGVAGNPSDGTLPASAIRTRREPRN